MPGAGASLCGSPPAAAAPPSPPPKSALEILRPASRAPGSPRAAPYSMPGAGARLCGSPPPPPASLSYNAFDDAPPGALPPPAPYSTAGAAGARRARSPPPPPAAPASYSPLKAAPSPEAAPALFSMWPSRAAISLSRASFLFARRLWLCALLIASAAAPPSPSYRALYARPPPTPEGGAWSGASSLGADAGRRAGVLSLSPHASKAALEFAPPGCFAGPPPSSMPGAREAAGPAPAAPAPAPSKRALCEAPAGLPAPAPYWSSGARLRRAGRWP
mmetsp:Transcript_52886/g.167905  ORF Transcript_52886/g.167905 Transcript_52886/m.167905 type:complete len:275 (+) Transcript_52886:385-1209(+)